MYGQVGSIRATWPWARLLLLDLINGSFKVHSKFEALRLLVSHSSLKSLGRAGEAKVRKTLGDVRARAPPSTQALFPKESSDFAAWRKRIVPKNAFECIRQIIFRCECVAKRGEIISVQGRVRWNSKTCP